MSKHENTRQSALRELLNEPGIAKARPIHQPADGALLTLEITQVMPYDRNPRKVKNPKYDDIKASILARGIEQSIKVTQRPGMPPHQFMISGGGNTRLAILHELYKETGSPRFQSHQFIYEAWKGESSNVIAHLIENTARGGMTLIDKAHAIFDAKSLMEEETEKSFTNRKLAEALKAAGLSSVFHTQINTYEFAVKTLYPVIPDLLNQGLGRRQINSINKLLNAAEQLWAHLCPDEETITPLLLQLLTRQNNAELNDGWQEQLQADVVRELAQGDRDDFEKIRLQLEYLLKHDRLLLVDEAATASLIPPVTKSEKKKPADAESAPKPESPAAQQQNPESEAKPAQSTEETDDTPLQEGDAIRTGSTSTETPESGEPGTFKPGTFQAAYLAKQAANAAMEDPDTLNALRISIFDLAHDLSELMFAESDDVDCVVSIDNGAGFYIKEFPSLVNTDKTPIYTDIEISPSQHNEHLCIRTANCIDFLLNIAEQFSSTATAVIEELNLYPENSLLATYHHTTVYGLQSDGSEPLTLETWRNIFDRRRHNSLTFSYYNLTTEESEYASRLMKTAIDEYQKMTALVYLQNGNLPLWAMEEQP